MIRHNYGQVLLSVLLQAVSIKKQSMSETLLDLCEIRGLLRRGNTSAYFRDEVHHNRPRIWSNWISSWQVKRRLCLTLLTRTALMCPVGALGVGDVWVGKTPRLPPLLSLPGTHTQSVQHLLTRRTQVKGMTKSMFLHLPWIPSRRSPHFGDKELTGRLRQTFAFAVDFLHCLTYLLGWQSVSLCWNVLAVEIIARSY